LVLGADRNDPALLTAELWIRTNRFTDKLYPMRDYLRESLGAQSLSPVTLYTRQREGRRRDEFNVTFNHFDHIVTMVRHYPRGVQTREFLSENPSGPISGALMALAQPLKVGDSLRFDTFISLNRYVFELDVVGHERISTPLGEFDAFRVVPSVAYASGGEIKDKAHRTTIWVSADARRLPLRIQSAVFIGSIRIELMEIIDAPRPTAPNAPVIRQAPAPIGLHQYRGPVGEFPRGAQPVTAENSESGEKSGVLAPASRKPYLR
jgi:hypothetical protein